MHCSECGKPMRGYGVLAADAPGTVPRGGNSVCQSCVNRRGGKPAPAPASDEPCVLVKVDLRPSTYRAFAVHAKALGVDVGELLSRLADKAVRPEDRTTAATPTTHDEPVARPAYVEDKVDRKIRELNGQRMSDNAISRMLGISQTTISKRRRRMLLESPTPRGGRPAKAA